MFPPNFIQLVRQKAQREQHVEKKQPSLEVPLESIHVKPVCVTKINLNEEIGILFFNFNLISLELINEIFFEGDN